MVTIKYHGCAPFSQNYFPEPVAVKSHGVVFCDTIISGLETEMDESLVGSPGFKPVREALTLSWVGSIPTRLRQILRFRNHRWHLNARHLQNQV